MLRVHLLQNWFGYSDPAMEEALYETTILLFLVDVDQALATHQHVAGVDAPVHLIAAATGQDAFERQLRQQRVVGAMAVFAQLVQ
ncbi:transposase, partial [Klebsiella pneumoniae]